ncbi:MAG: class I SAM-dependent methyltransferase [Nocardioides sp.]|uniref:class I SAM-dependent methyltransferase n=1 Tax=Nocardioides sp. TaxID=35761 RepID=UPI003F03AAB4
MEQRYTHGHHEAVLASHRWRTAQNSAGYLLGRLAEGQRLLDVGSGPGTITADLARIVGPQNLTALEATESAIELTRSECERQGLHGITYLVGDVHALDLPDDSYDVVHAHQVLQHVADPVLALTEMRRVCRPDGVVAVRDADYAAFTWYPELPELDRWMALYQRAARENLGEPDAGRRLLAWANAAGFSRVDPSAELWCFATAQDREYWGGMWERRILDGAFPEQLLAGGFATPEELKEISGAWRRWADDPDGWLIVPNGEVLARP